MPVRQYIGARYVPTYYQNSLDPTSSEWEANVNYDPLTIVSLPNMHSYQSKKFVPSTIGSPASNPEYWYDQGYASAYYQALQDQIDDMNDGTVPGSLQNQINDMKDGTVVGSLQDQINDNASEISLLKNKCYIVISDSYGNYLDSNNQNFIESAFTKLGINDYYDFHYGGAGFVGNATSFLYVLQINESVITDKSKITDIIVCGAANDMNKSSADLLSHMSAFKSYVKNNYSNAKISVMALSRSMAAADIAYNSSVNERYKRCCSDAGLAFVDNSEWVMSRMSYFSTVDAVHPTADGVTACARALTDYILNGTISVVDSIDGFVKLINANTGALVNYSKQEFINGICSIKSKGNAGSIFVNFSTSISLNAGPNVVSDLFDFADTFIFPTSNNSLIITIQISCGNDIYDGYLYFGATTDYLQHHVGLIINNRYGTTKTITGPTSIGIGATSFSMFA